MRKIDTPSHHVRPTLKLCVSLIADTDLKARAESVGDDLVSGESIYRKLATENALYTATGSTAVGSLTKDEMVSLYKQRLSKQGQPARAVYDSLRAAAKFNICPLCGHRPVATLDHYLPKSSHPLFAITPLNLVPCCTDCNKVKRSDVATDIESQKFHPYFDDFDDGSWLRAQIIESTPPAIRFFVGSPAGWDKVKSQRAANHFSKLELAGLYGSNAAQELAQIAGILHELAVTAGPGEVKVHLEAQSRSRAAIARNSWQAAMYDALSRSEWFWNGGYKMIKK